MPFYFFSGSFWQSTLRSLGSVGNLYSMLCRENDDMPAPNPCSHYAGRLPCLENPALRKRHLRRPPPLDLPPSEQRPKTRPKNGLRTAAVPHHFVLWLKSTPWWTTGRNRSLVVLRKMVSETQFAPSHWPCASHRDTSPLRDKRRPKQSGSQLPSERTQRWRSGFL